MPTSFLTRPRFQRAVLPLSALLLAATGLCAASGCVALRPRDERADGGVGPLDLGGDGGQDPGDAARDMFVEPCEQDGACTCTPAITALSLGVVAHGARLVLTGGCFTDVTTVSVGGASQTFTVDDDAQITIDAVTDGASVGLAQSVIVTSPVGSSAPRSATVVHVVVNEVDALTDMGGMQRRQFVEVATGLPASVSLSEYMLVFFTGADDGVYDTTRGVVLGTTTEDGLYLFANTMVSGAQATFPNSTLATASGAHAVVIYQGSVLPPSTATLTTVSAPMVDALVFSTTAVAGDAGLLEACYPVVADRVQLDEAANGGEALTQSVRRCGTERRSGTAFGVAAPTPGAANGCP